MNVESLRKAVTARSRTVYYTHQGVTRKVVYQDIRTMRRLLAILDRLRTHRIDVPVSTAETYCHPRRIVDRAVHRAKPSC